MGIYRNDPPSNPWVDADTGLLAGHWYTHADHPDYRVLVVVAADTTIRGIVCRRIVEDATNPWWQGIATIDLTVDDVPKMFLQETTTESENK